MNRVHIRPLEALRFKIEDANDGIRPVDGFDQSRVIRNPEVSLKPHYGYRHGIQFLSRLF